MLNFDAPPIKNILPILLRDLKIDKLPKPRALKSDDEKFLRTRTLAEVFTPSRIVKFMVDAIDDGKIDSRCLEIACGEAPFITNRYDAESGQKISVNERAGILDKKLRRIPAGVDKFTWASRAVQSVYGYELQADSLLIARANVLLTVAEFVGDCSDDELEEFAEIISRNFWQADALNPPSVQISLFDDATDWNTGNEFFWGSSDMKKFDLVIGNPPYQDETAGDNKTFAPPVYNKFMEEAYKVGEKVELITPARFLFDAGATPKDFNQRMLNDPHLKVLDYAPDASKYFKGVDIKGGVAITLHDETKDFGAIRTFIALDELRSIHQKVCVDNPDFKPFSDKVYGRTSYRLSRKFIEENPDAPFLERRSDFLKSNVFEYAAEYFFDDKPDDGHEYIEVLGYINNQRKFKWFRCDYIIPSGRNMNLDKYKVFLPDSNGSGILGEILSAPLIGMPLVANTQTFITFGAFDTRAEAEACISYIKSKFCRVMLGILKVTQHNPSATWAKVPSQDFNPTTSDIDWSGDIDAQLYKKYRLDDAEINFIESHVREMA